MFHKFAEPLEVRRFLLDGSQVFRSQIFRPAFHPVGVADLVERPFLLPGVPVLVAPGRMEPRSINCCFTRSICPTNCSHGVEMSPPLGDKGVVYIGYPVNLTMESIP